MFARYFVEEADADAAQDRGPEAGVAAAVCGGANSPVNRRLQEPNGAVEPQPPPVPGSFRRRLSGLT